MKVRMKNQKTGEEKCLSPVVEFTDVSLNLGLIASVYAVSVHGRSVKVSETAYDIVNPDGERVIVLTVEHDEQK